MKRDHISYSQIQTAKCLYRYKLLYIDEEVERKSVRMEVGKAVHQIICDYTQKCLDENVDSDFDFMDEAISVAVQASGLNPDEYPEVRKICINFAEKGFRREYTLSAEQAVRAVIGQDEQGKDIIVEARIDRIDTWEHPVSGVCLDVIDYKNQLNILTAAQVDESRQLALYRYLAFNHLGLKGYTLSRVGIYFTQYNYLRWNSIEAIPIGEYYEDFRAVEDWLRLHWSRIMYAKEYEPERGPWCWENEGCPVMEAGKCPLWTEKQIVEEKEKHTVEGLARFVRMIDHRRKQGLDELKALMSEAEENVEVDGGMVGHVGTVTTTYKLSEILAWGELFGVSFDDIEVSKTAVEKAIKSQKKLKADELPEDETFALEGARMETAGSKFVYK